MNCQQPQVTLAYVDKKQITVDASNHKFQHWDYNYALTVYAAQGATKKTVLALLESYRENLIHQPAFLVALTRAVDTFRVYTDNIIALLERIEKNSGMKLSALETIGEVTKLTKTGKKNSLQTESKARKNFGFDKPTIERMIEALNQDAEKIATDFLGKPASRAPTYLQFGSNKGSLRVTIQGSKSGLWNDFSGEFSQHGKTGGNMFQFLQILGGMSKKEALEYSARRFGFMKEGEVNPDKKENSQWKKESEKRLKSQQIAEQKQQEKRMQFARKLAEESKPIEGTLAEKYLKEQRGIILNSYPSDIRFHEGVYSKLNEKTYPAMLVLVRDKDGNIRAVQATYLDSDCKKIDKNSHAIQKQTFGVLGGSAVTVKGTKSGSTLIVEGVETGLSLAQACPEKDVKILLGKSNLLHINAKDISKNITFCLDNDGKNIREDKIIFESAKRLREAGKQVNLVVPTTLGNIKQDYNDVLKKSGVEPIKQDIQKAVSFHDFYQNRPLNTRISQAIPQDKINQFAREMTNQSLKAEQRLLSAHRQINSPDLNKPIVRQPQVDREI